jgi:hypothetical protein
MGAGALWGAWYAAWRGGCGVIYPRGQVNGVSMHGFQSRIRRRESFFLEMAIYDSEQQKLLVGIIMATTEFQGKMPLGYFVPR